MFEDSILDVFPYITYRTENSQPNSLFHLHNLKAKLIYNGAFDRAGWELTREETGYSLKSLSSQVT